MPPGPVQHRRDTERAGAVERVEQFPYRAESALRVTHHELHGVRGERRDEITIAATVNESNATSQYLDDSSNTPIPDADTTKNGRQQVSLEGGEHDQGAGDGAGTTPPRTYTVTVTRGSGGTTPITSTDATLSALALSNASNDSAYHAESDICAGTRPTRRLWRTTWTRSRSRRL